MIDENGQHWIVLVPGMELPEEQPKGFQFWDGCEWDSWPPSFRPMNESNTYRYPVTEAEYKAHHWCLAHGIEAPEGYEVVGFGHTKDKVDEWLCSDGELRYYQTEQGIVGYLILRKKACEHKDIYLDHEVMLIKCVDCGMIRELGDWEESK